MIPAAIAVQRPADAKLMVVDASGRLVHRPRADLPALVHSGDLVIANDAATLPASLFGIHAATNSPIELRLAGRRSLLDRLRDDSGTTTGPKALRQPMRVSIVCSSSRPSIP